ncbi:MAG TPA: hypothetical protein VGP82_03590 [Ktedonobacterales bacterium]|jgi:hypothetical protein|nr:hypothetical protein [Ktedonobacterales bacterium]
MLSALLWIALVVFVIWLMLTIAGALFGGLVHLLWIVIVIALVVWLLQVLSGRRNTV